VTFPADILIENGRIAAIGHDLKGDTASTPPAAT
jgi:dihydroorotase-like cyclic amidohydrolase